MLLAILFWVVLSKITVLGRRDFAYIFPINWNSPKKELILSPLGTRGILGALRLYSDTVLKMVRAGIWIRLIGVRSLNSTLASASLWEFAAVIVHQNSLAFCVPAQGNLPVEFSKKMISVFQMLGFCAVLSTLPLIFKSMSVSRGI